MQTLLGHPADGLSFDLYAIVGGTEDTVPELEVKIKSSLGPKVTEVEAKLIVLQGELKKFRSSTGDELLTRLAHLETSVRVLESTATPDTLAKVVVKDCYQARLQCEAVDLARRFVGELGQWTPPGMLRAPEPS
jgi:hypothetical protein